VLRQSASKRRDPPRIRTASQLSATRRARADGATEPQVRVDTALGQLVIGVFTSRAPRTAANFLRYVDGRHLDGCSIYRIVTPENQYPPPPVSTSVVQWGMGLGELSSPLFPPVAHEPTSITGLTHCDGAVSLARFAPGTGSSEFFFCLGDQPQLDFGGRRNADGAGFAVFGQVVSGEAVLAAIYARAETNHLLRRPIPIREVSRLAVSP
jgi:peptidyl-prolyl cis-trans isomerase A (cyclophilin A)